MEWTEEINRCAMREEEGRDDIKVFETDGVM